MTPSATKVEVTFQRSITLWVACAALVLASAEESFWPSGLTVPLALLTHILVDRRRTIRLSVGFANMLGVVAFFAMAAEFYGSDLLRKLLSGAHLLVYMTWVVLLMDKGIRQYWWLAALSTLQVSVASVLTTNPSFGAALVGMQLLAIWTLSLFTLFRARLSQSQGAGAQDSLSKAAEATMSTDGIDVMHGLQIDAHEAWIGWRFRGIVSFAFVASLLIGVVAFAAFPRIWVPQSPLAGLPSASNPLTQQTGFTENVSLGEIGQIMQSDRRVLQFELTEMSSGNSVTPEVFADSMKMDEILFRGNVHGTYRDGQWSSSSRNVRGTGDIELTQPNFNRSQRASDYRLKITQDPPIGTFAFAPAPVTNAFRAGRRGVKQRRRSLSLVHWLGAAVRRDEPLEYEVWCTRPPAWQNFHSPERLGMLDVVTQRLKNELELVTQGRAVGDQMHTAGYITENLPQQLPQLTKLAQELCALDEGLIPERQRIDRIVSYLSVNGGFRYSLTADVIDSGIDPVEDFLLNRKSGHCEYFGSACALMLQSVDIPARIVNGYKGCELNSVTGQWEVKQKHAHTWLEAYIDGHWETLDPTPAAARNELVVQSGALDWWADLNTAVRDGWYDAVQKMSLERQEAIIRPWLDRLQKAIRTIKQQGLRAALLEFYNEVILQPHKWVSWRTGVATFVLLLIPGLWLRRRPGKWLWTHQLRLFRRLFRGSDQKTTMVRFYENFRDQCARHGLRFPDSQTPLENAQQAVQHFSQRLPEGADRLLPEKIAGVFNQVRYGNVELSADDLASVRSNIRRFFELVDAEASQ